MQKVFALGSNGSGQLGIGHTEDVQTPTECLFDDDTTTADNNNNNNNNNNENSAEETRKVKRIVCGGNHTIILFDNGHAYAAGLNDDGRCGVTPTPDPDNPDNNNRFKRIILRRKDPSNDQAAFIDRFSHVSATWAATVFVSAEKEEQIVIVLGSGDKGELGLGLGRTETTTLKDRESVDVDACIIPNFPPPNTAIKSISSGTNHTVAILSNGDVYGWGAARKGQLGGNSALIGRKVAWEPVRIALQEDFLPEEVACGREFTFISGLKSLEDSTKKEEYRYTILGTNGKWNIISGAPSLQELKKDSPRRQYTVSASWHGVYLYDSIDNSGLAWGRNDRGQLGPLSTTVQQPFTADQPTRSEGVAQFVAGSEHAVALLLDNKTVLACGWGEHGNCGSSTDGQGDVKGGRVSHIALPDEILHDDKAKVVRLAGGCATTWIVASS